MGRPKRDRSNRRTPTTKKRPDKIVAEICHEIREILRMREELATPLPLVPVWDPQHGPRFAAMFDLRLPRLNMRGLQLRSLGKLAVPSERIRSRVLELAAAVWHLKDRLNNWAKETGRPRDLVEQYATGHPRLTVCCDLANRKKHGWSDRSRLNPRLGEVEFDTSKSGAVEFAYDGAAKEDILVVSNQVPIPFTVPLLLANGSQPIRDAVAFIFQTFLQWLPLIDNLGVLARDDAESRYLRTRLPLIADEARSSAAALVTQGQGTDPKTPASSGNP